MNAATRGVILAIAGVVLGIIILGQGFDDPVAVSAGGSDTAEPTPTLDDSGDPDATPTEGDGSEPNGDEPPTDATPGDPGEVPPTVTHPPETVRLLVANGTDVTGAAGTKSNELEAARGYIPLNPANVLEGVEVTATVIYFAEGYDLDALDVATQLGVAATAVQPLPADPPVSDLQEAHILVVLGPDLVQPAG